MKKHNKQWDAYYDEEKDIWLEEGCGQSGCNLCNNRPDKPSECKK